MLKELFTQQQRNLTTFFEKIDLAKAEEILELFYRCEGMIVFTGVGKSGIVAKKLAVTMTSTGTRSLFLSPTNALHGDIGIVNERDVFVMLSKSGESDELLQLVPYLRNRKVKMVGMVSNPDSRIGKVCDMTIVLPMEQELCPFDLVPTTSAAIQMIFGDILAIALMQKKQFSLDEYARNHPAGRIGKRITLQVKDLMITGEGVPKCLPTDRLLSVLHELSDKRCGCVLVVNDEQELLGIFTDGDLRRALQKLGEGVLELTMEKLMSVTARSITPEALAAHAIDLMESDPSRPITILPVLNPKKQVLGLVKMHDLVQSGIR